MSFDLIIAAGGESVRFGGEKNKLFSDIGGRTVIEGALRPFLAFPDLTKVIVVINPSLRAEAQAILSPLYPKMIFVDGGPSRTQSVRNGLEYVTADKVLIHDGARPFVDGSTIDRVLQGLEKQGASIPVIPITDSIADVSEGYVPVNRESYRAVQTPQGFLTARIKAAYAQALGNFSDDATVYLTQFEDVEIVHGSKHNKKITLSDDLLLPLCRTGAGFDTHLLSEGRRLVLGGVEIAHDRGLLGHSDADVLLHAIMDALLCAAGLRDIGFYFPDTDEAYRDISSLTLFSRVMDLLSNDGFAVHNIAATLLAEKPRLSPYIPDIIHSIASAAKICDDMVSVAATTTEGMGDIGQCLAISAIAVVTIIDKNR